MSNSVLPFRYSSVLADIVLTNKLELDFYLSSFNFLLGIDEIANFFFSPFISKDKKMDLVNEISVLIADKYEKDSAKKGKNIFIKFINELLYYKRIEFFSEIFAAYRKQISNMKNEMNCNAIFATEVDETVVKKLKVMLSKFFNHDTNVNLSIDNSLIAGVKLWIGNYLIDASLKSRLDKLEKNLLEE